LGCTAFASAVCVDVDDPKPPNDGGKSGTGLCFEACVVGDGDASKCHGRAGVACTPVEGAAPGAYCRPVCSTNADCASGACDPVRSVCVSSPSVDTTFGLRCTSSGDAGDGSVEGGGGSGLDDAGDGATATDGAAADAGADAADDGGRPPVNLRTLSCGDVCVSLDPMASACSRRCVFGSTSECAPASGSLRRGGCLFVTMGGGIGDLGYCAELCDCNDDCIEPTFVCDAFNDTKLESAFGRKGVCTPPELVINHPLGCGD
jgi:hypothetical protein